MYSNDQVKLLAYTFQMGIGNINVDAIVLFYFKTDDKSSRGNS